MTGPEVKKILIDHKLQLKDVAQMLGLSQPNFTQLLQVKDVKTGLLEKICDVLGKRMDFFYGGTTYLPSDHKVAEEPVSKEKENEYLKGQISVLKDINEKLMKVLAETIAERNESKSENN